MLLTTPRKEPKRWKGIIVGMDDKQLNSLSKIQMLRILHQQEKEIEALTEEFNRPQVRTEAELLSEIMSSAQDAADSYILGVKSSERKKIEDIAELEKMTRQSYEEAEQVRADTVILTRSLLSDFSRVFELMIESIKVTQEKFNDRINTMSVDGYFPAMQRGKISS